MNPWRLVKTILGEVQLAYTSITCLLPDLKSLIPSVSWLCSVVPSPSHSFSLIPTWTQKEPARPECFEVFSSAKENSPCYSKTVISSKKRNFSPPLYSFYFGIITSADGKNCCWCIGKVTWLMKTPQNSLIRKGSKRKAYWPKRFGHLDYGLYSIRNSCVCVLLSFVICAYVMLMLGLASSGPSSRLL